jgi:hypothetical protein
MTNGTASPGERLRALLEPERPDAAAIAACLDGLSHPDRVVAVRSLGGTKLQGKLYQVVAGAPPVALADLVPPDAPPLREVIFHGKNSLAAFTLFQKRFCRPPGARGQDELWGYNHQALAWLTGPGYFVVHEDGREGAAIDYRQVPPEHPPAWPEVRPNSQGLSRLVYNNMVDYLRRVSRDVFIGSAYRGGKSINSYFLLCREP